MGDEWFQLDLLTPRRTFTCSGFLSGKIDANHPRYWGNRLQLNKGKKKKKNPFFGVFGVFWVGMAMVASLTAVTRFVW